MDDKSKYSAGAQALGYIYQSRFALLQMLQMSEDTAMFIERSDDLEFIKEGELSLASLKHKSEGDKVSDLSVDFWKSVNIWIDRYLSSNYDSDELSFFLFTTSEISNGSFIEKLCPGKTRDVDNAISIANDAIDKTENKIIIKIKGKLSKLSQVEKADFYGRIFIFNNTVRIEDIPSEIQNKYMRTVPRKNRESVFEKLEGWWGDLIIRLLTGERENSVYSREISDKLAQIHDQYKSDNLPITFQNSRPSEIDVNTDDRVFVRQLREIGVSSARIETAILDYYRAFEQRAEWAREQLLMNEEINSYEDRLIEEWKRMKDIVLDEVDEETSEITLNKVGRNIYKWVEMNTKHLRIRERVEHTFVVTGSYHILANHHPMPKVFWHPLFLEKIEETVDV